ncbi:Diffuse panbronchiolitis critical region protein 1-like protein [Microtus ochrogaster]|uniref:Diffuse panbronchiolitis critical region protein 1-like protein n=1 Tax=Microtus ochrogaster TaxID=79684 RepID=A0A8J6G7Y9_MICOH|nr:Diffuse panbronchiolitis critical region protein 1-like protein [Microtus ochrogaster]
MKGPWSVVPQQPPSSDMAQLTSSLCSTFGFLCCLFFLPASWEAGANTVQELQKTGEPSTSDHLLTLTPGLTHKALSVHTDLNPQRAPDLPKSTATQKPKKRCTTVGLDKPVHKSVDNSKATGNQNTTVRHEMTPALVMNATSPGKDPMIRNGRSADDPKSTNTEKGSEGSHPTSAPRRRTTCKSTTSKTRVTRNSGTPMRPVDTSTGLRTTSRKPTTPSHDSELSRKTTSSSVKSSEAPKTSYRTPRTPATPGAEAHRTPFASDKPEKMTTEHIKETSSASEKTTRVQATPTPYESENSSASEKTTRAQATPTPYESETVSANEKTTRAQATPTPYESETVSANERTTRAQATPTPYESETSSASEKTTRSQATPTPYESETSSANERTTRAQVMPVEHDTTLANQKTTQVSAKSTEHPEEATSTTQEATRVSQSPTVFRRKTTLTTKPIKTPGNPEKTGAVLVSTGPSVKVTKDKSTALSPRLQKSETTQRGLLCSVTTRTDLGSSTSGTHQQLSSHSSPGGLHAEGAKGENNPFPAWAIVVVILLAVIVLLIFIGLIFLVACASRTHRVLTTQNSEDFDPEDRGGRNSYPVYLMEQQNLKPSQIPSPP